MEIEVDVFETQPLRVEVDVIEIRYRDMGESSLTPDSVDQVFNAFDRVPISETDFLVGKGKRLFSWASIKQMFAPVNHGHSYNSLSDRPIIPSIAGLASQIWTSAGFVAQVPGKSLLSNDEIARLGGLGNYNDTELRQMIANRVIKEIGKSLLDDTEIARLLGLHNYDDSAVVAELAKKINRDETLSATEIQLLITNLVDSSPEALNTLRELSNALNDDPHFATTVMTKIGEKVTAIAGKSLLLDTEIERLSHLVNYDDAALRLLIGEKVTAVTGKSLILDTEIERLSHLANYDDTAIRQLISGLKASDIAETTTRMWLTNLLKDQYDAAVSASHIHANQSILDQITQGVFDGWSGKLAATKAAIEGLLTGNITTHSHTAANTSTTKGNTQSDIDTLFLLDSREYQNRRGVIEIVDNLRTTTALQPSFRQALSGGTAVARGDGLIVITCSNTANSGFRFDLLQNVPSVPHSFYNQYDFVFSITDLTNIYLKGGFMSNVITDEIRPCFNFKITSGGNIVTQTYLNALNTNQLVVPGTSTPFTTLVAGTVYHIRIKPTSSSITFEVYNTTGVLIANYVATTQIPVGGGSANMFGTLMIDTAGVTAREIVRMYHHTGKLNAYSYGALT